MMPSQQLGGWPWTPAPVVTPKVVHFPTIAGWERGQAHYRCESCRVIHSLTAIPGNGGDVVGSIPCLCGGEAALASTIRDSE